ncbi:putative NAD(P)H nitroreductase YodC [bioreactor metagenome]|uniref:Putative NAD(P)H nitroreductase YodC n=1 Tax=bioreactor metagenome TaxID=1076179 RepID=A0A645C1X6_9ZZZZ
MILDVIKKRRSVRHYLAKPIAEEQINEILEAAMLAPTARNLQEWRFIAVTDKTKLQAIAKLNSHAQMTAEAALSIIICGDTNINKPEYIYADCGAAIENMLLQALSMDIGSCWCAIGPDEVRLKTYREFYQIPDHLIPVAAVQFGYLIEPTTEVKRFDGQKVIYYR